MPSRSAKGYPMPTEQAPPFLVDAVRAAASKMQGMKAALDAGARTASTKNGGACSVGMVYPFAERDGIASPHPVINDWTKKSAVTIKDRAPGTLRARL